LDIRPVAGACGAEIFNIDLSKDLTPKLFQAVNQVLLDYGVIFFRDQDITPAQQLAFAAHWGAIHDSAHQPSLPGTPGVMPVIKEAEETAAIGDNWHTDQMHTTVPAMGSILYALDVPAFGGDTMFSNMYLAYDALPEDMKLKLSRVKTRNRYSTERARSRTLRQTFEADEVPTIEHPLFRTHPETGRTSLYLAYKGITRGFVGMSDEEGDALHNLLYMHVSRPEFTCRFRWAKGSMAFWDNRCMLHVAVNDYHGQRREMHRVTIKGAPVVAAT
jgi:taurine dioxygenase